MCTDARLAAFQALSDGPQFWKVMSSKGTECQHERTMYITSWIMRVSRVRIF